MLEDRGDPVFAGALRLRIGKFVDNTQHQAVGRIRDGAFGVRGMNRNILAFVGLKPIRTTLIGSIETLSDDKRRRWLDRMHEAGTSL